MNDDRSIKKNSKERPKKRRGMRLRAKLIWVFVAVMVIPLLILTGITWNRIITLGNILLDISVTDSTTALNDLARDNLEG